MTQISIQKQDISRLASVIAFFSMLLSGFGIFILACTVGAVFGLAFFYPEKWQGGLHVVVVAYILCRLIQWGDR